MGEVFDHISEKVQKFIEAQPMFITASACDTGRVNVSPKGMDSFRVFGPNLVGYLDLTGSGNETAAHLKHDGRLTIMFMSFSRNPKIIRLSGQGYVVGKGSGKFAELAKVFPDYHGCRQIIMLKVDRVQDSCGYTVPQMDLVTERGTLIKWSETKTSQEMVEYRKTKNLKSIDGFETGLVE